MIAYGKKLKREFLLLLKKRFIHYSYARQIYKQGGTKDQDCETQQGQKEEEIGKLILT